MQSGREIRSPESRTWHCCAHLEIAIIGWPFIASRRLSHPEFPYRFYRMIVHWAELPTVICVRLENGIATGYAIVTDTLTVPPTVFSEP
jgi:hypothetical protein